MTECKLCRVQSAYLFSPDVRAQNFWLRLGFEETGLDELVEKARNHYQVIEFAKACARGKCWKTKAYRRHVP
ncbi:hypothetical protein SBA4_5030005 [Candidatus Sulfopaludibacter sp. SbA4]|nr:hypothetical protein SBA4_5030005 [Candidatus Sulfopaludibacter sp. SbA4]